MKTIPTYIFILFINILTAQTLKFFCKVPKEELGGTEQAGILQKIVADSQYIYLVGQQPNEIKGFKNTNILFFSKIDYSGHVEKASLVLDPSITLNPTDIDPLIKLTDTTYIIYLAYQDTTSSNTNFYLTLEELNFRRYTLKRKFIFSDTLMEQDIAFIPESKKSIQVSCLTIFDLIPHHCPIRIEFMNLMAILKLKDLLSFQLILNHPQAFTGWISSIMVIMNLLA